jgi:hypothetical protein
MAPKPSSIAIISVICASSALLAHDPPAGCERFLSAWDPLPAGAGVDLSGCGLEVTADTGSFTAEHGKVTLVPGSRDDLGLGATIALAATSAEAEHPLPRDSYRIRFNFIGRPGITDAAFFVETRYALHPESGAIDASTFAAVGVNFTFDAMGHDDISDHIHPDVRGACLSEQGFSGEANIDYPGFIMTTETEWTMTIDVEGDAVNGPLVCLVKLFRAGDPEPLLPFASYSVPLGVGEGTDEVRHALLAAALGGGSLEIHDASICEVPGIERRVQNLSCAEEGEHIRVTWENPPGANLDAPIIVLVGGAEVASLPGSTTEYEVEGPHEGATEIAIVNSSGVAATCTVGEHAPEAHYLRGDCNAGGTVDLSDAVFLLNYLFSGESAPTCKDACNANGDDSNNISDPLHILNYLFLGMAAPVPPFPGCGHGHVELGCDMEHCPHA